MATKPTSRQSEGLQHRKASLEEAMAALQLQEKNDMAAIRQGIENMETGREMSQEESRKLNEAVLACLKKSAGS